MYGLCRRRILLGKIRATFVPYWRLRVVQSVSIMHIQIGYGLTSDLESFLPIL